MNTNSNNSEIQNVAPAATSINPNNVAMEETQVQLNSAEQEKDAQAIAGARPADKVEASKKKDNKPVYEGEEKVLLTELTKVCEEEVARVISDSRYGAVPYAGGKNCLIDLRNVHSELYTPVVNREHGKDQEKTGESLLSFGAQHVLLIITVRMAKKTCLLPARFKNDPNADKPISDDGLVLLDGNGRVNFLMSLPVDEWPEIYGVFPTKDAAGFFNLNRAFDIINTQVSVWKTQDMVQKRQLMDGSNAHPGWGFIQGLVKKGYKYQAACQLATLFTDRIKKGQVTGGDATIVFTHYESAQKICNALFLKFGEDSDCLKTKEFTKELNTLWGKLQKKSGDDAATETFVKFLKGLPAAKVKAVNEAKNIKGGASKDEQRKDILTQEFYKFIGAEGILVD